MGASRGSCRRRRARGPGRGVRRRRRRRRAQRVRFQRRGSGLRRGRAILSLRRSTCHRRRRERWRRRNCVEGSVISVRIAGNYFFLVFSSFLGNVGDLGVHACWLTLLNPCFCFRRLRRHRLLSLRCCQMIRRSRSCLMSQTSLMSLTILMNRRIRCFDLLHRRSRRRLVAWRDSLLILD